MTKLISPAPNGWRNTDYGFGSTNKPYSASRPHKGQDWGWYNANIAASRRVVAPVSGTVSYVYSGGGYNEGWGNRVAIRVNDRVTSTLNHLASRSINVRVGQYINAGDSVATMGATGETGGAVHLHEELYIDGNRVDPQYYRSHDLPGTESPSGGGSSADPFYPANPSELEYPEMFIAAINTKYKNWGAGTWFLVVPNGAGKPRAVVLDGTSGAAGSGLPILNFTQQWSIDNLAAAVDGF